VTTSKSLLNIEAIV